LDDVLEVSQIRVNEPQFSNVLQSLFHFHKLPVGQAMDGVPVPHIMDNFKIKLDQIIRGYEVVQKSAVAYG
jgi:hypothetical protein